MTINASGVLRPGIFRFRVPDRITNASIEIGADYNIGTIAIYKYGKEQN